MSVDAYWIHLVADLVLPGFRGALRHDEKPAPKYYLTK